MPFFSNKNDDPALLMEVAHWWIMEQKLDHFEKAVKIKSLVLEVPVAITGDEGEDGVYCV